MKDGKKFPSVDKSKEKMENSCSQEELDALELFCESVEFDDLSFDEWKGQNQDLNLYLEAFISKSEARLGGEKVISFTRSKFLLTGGSEKKKSQVTVPWPKNTSRDIRSEFDCLGDEDEDGHVGTLFVRIFIK